MKLAQGILCGSWALAFPFDWARQIVDQFELSPVPKAPGWLLGAANVDGNILPVVDLQAYLNQSMPASARQQRLLIGGLSGTQSSADTTGDAIAIAFEGLPQQLGYEQRALTYASALPPRLRELCTGVGSNSAGHEFLEIDAERLLAALSDELAQV
ncbi:chemotaxis protein CheW [Variovorax sp. PCZ-1]|uniref:chemotaxis protein CheW n=1 Tax=Variovorax sp. PCZ-1 TaxID=2835533 RepID=UPI001BCF87A7|nr:chemotaxis protein CheW [Variovorax sp. PCZ-1]MBS7808663.1 chemotaxis protein CheW [Variovorax sp. PCZ-1]